MKISAAFIAAASAYLVGTTQASPVRPKSGGSSRPHVVTGHPVPEGAQYGLNLNLPPAYGIPVEPIREDIHAPHFYRGSGIPSNIYDSTSHFTNYGYPETDTEIVYEHPTGLSLQESNDFDYSHQGHSMPEWHDYPYNQGYGPDSSRGEINISESPSVSYKKSRQATKLLQKKNFREARRLALERDQKRMYDQEGSEAFATTSSLRSPSEHLRQYSSNYPVADPSPEPSPAGSPGHEEGSPSSPHDKELVDDFSQMSIGNPSASGNDATHWHDAKLETARSNFNSKQAMPDQEKNAILQGQHLASNEEGSSNPTGKGKKPNRSGDY